MFLEYSKFIGSIIGIVGGFALMLGAFSKKSSAPQWSKKALFLAGLCFLAWGSLIFIKSNYEQTITARNLRLMEHYKTILGGLGLGILITLFLSGELSFKKCGKKRIEDNRENPKT